MNKETKTETKTETETEKQTKRLKLVDELLENSISLMCTVDGNSLSKLIKLGAKPTYYVLQQMIEKNDSMGVAVITDYGIENINDEKNNSLIFSHHEYYQKNCIKLALKKYNTAVENKCDTDTILRILKLLFTHFNHL